MQNVHRGILVSGIAIASLALAFAAIALLPRDVGQGRVRQCDRVQQLSRMTLPEGVKVEGYVAWDARPPMIPGTPCWCCRCASARIQLRCSWPRCSASDGRENRPGLEACPGRGGRRAVTAL